MNLKIAEIFADPDFNCRGEIIPFDVTELMDSISKNGLLQPIVVQPYTQNGYSYRVVMGHRRYTACKLLNMEEAPCIVNENLTENQARAVNLIENLERKNLNLMQEARAIAKFYTAGLTQVQVGELIGKSYGWVQLRIMALKMPKEIQDEIEAGFIGTEMIRDLYTYNGNKDAQMSMVREIKDRRLRGDKSRIRLKVPKPKQHGNPLEKRERTPAEIFKMQEDIRLALGNNVLTRLLAWCCGEISNQDIHHDLAKYAVSIDKIFLPPADRIAP